MLEVKENHLKIIDSEQRYNNPEYNEALDVRLKRLYQLSQTPIESVTATKILKRDENV